jgi:hypothetical protein
MLPEARRAAYRHGYNAPPGSCAGSAPVTRLRGRVAPRGVALWRGAPPVRTPPTGPAIRLRSPRP